MLFGRFAAFFGERVFLYLLDAQKQTLTWLQGGEHRFKRVDTPSDYISYQSFVDFCFDCCRSNLKEPFNKRMIELKMLDRNQLFSIDEQDLNLLEEGLQQFRT